MCLTCISAKTDHRPVIVVLLVLYFVEISLSEPTPEDSVSNSFNFNLGSDDSADISAYLNVTYKSDFGWKSDVADVGRYGGGFIGSAHGLLVHVTSKHQPGDHSGCVYPFESSRSDGKLPPPGTPWVALIQRGHCNFDVKVDNAFKSKASAALVYNDRTSGTLEKMKLTYDDKRNITAVFTYKWKGEQLAKLLENDSNVYIQITISERKTSKSGDINRRIRLMEEIRNDTKSAVKVSENKKNCKKLQVFYHWLNRKIKSLNANN
ncbi:hypothetical protein ABEB36_013826 [Hypothenemus hampei]|uniref:PA domain-containing protein n=1 Tax=Hypothenemus hampei TaxID=57062 RepID=A0ABD1E5L3_HYPHA